MATELDEARGDNSCIEKAKASTLKMAATPKIDEQNYKEEIQMMISNKF